jgi:MFS family permease
MGEEHKEEDIAQEHPYIVTHGSSAIPTETLIPPSEQSIKKETVFQQATSEALRPFVIISSSYLLFTITDGAIRMIVLLHAYTNDFSALEVAIMFSLYELAGVFTNLAAGFMGAKWGIRCTLISGLALQLLAYGCVMLRRSFVNELNLDLLFARVPTEHFYYSALILQLIVWLE